MDSSEALIALNMIEGVGPVRARSLIDYFGEAPKILSASKNELLRVPNIGEDTAERIAARERSVDHRRRAAMQEPLPFSFVVCETILAAPIRNRYFMRMVAREAFIALNMIEGVGPVRARSLLEHFGDAPKILAASKSALLRVPNIGEDTAEKIAAWEKSVDLADELKRIADFGCHVLIASDDDYPPLLREIYDPPLVQFGPIWKTLNASQ